MEDIKPKVYLAGGLKTNWQKQVIKKGKGKFRFFNPKQHLLDEGKEYTSWDLHHVRKCDIFFAYMEETNPSGIGLSLEIGLAIGLGKTVILVDEKSKTDVIFAKQFRIIRESVTITFENLKDGITMLLSFSRGIC